MKYDDDDDPTIISIFFLYCQINKYFILYYRCFLYCIVIVVGVLVAGVIYHFTIFTFFFFVWEKRATDGTKG